jgi:DNA-directed RNA polymerase subunit E'
MYQVVTLEDEIAVPPTKFGLDIDSSLKESVGDKYEGKIDNTIGVVLSVMKIEEVKEGSILPGDPSVHYPVRFKVLSWMPQNHEIVEGAVVDITEFGAFIRAGALDGLVHVSQIMDDFVSYDEKNAQLAGKQSRRVLKEGDSVRARIISISFKEQSKVGLTMRQPYLGAIKWLEADAKEKIKEEKPAKKETKKETKKKGK